MASVLENLEDADLLRFGRRQQLQLTREPERIALAEILHAARARRRGHRLLRLVSLPVVTTLHQELEAHLRAALGERTLAQLAGKDPPPW
jgi:hypothetical protein